ncbi:MAG: helix-turn-helix domain-containing protein [Muribaculaceae bacterium]|nr:helix-turn-helix domain-containing protein [Muribaculaceae bacterium]
MDFSYKYDLNLPQDVSSILEHEFWIIEDIGPEMLASIMDPVKFSAATWIFVKQGNCEADLNLINYKISGPTLVTVESSQILHPRFVSRDFKASIIVMSKTFRDNLSLFLANTPISPIMSRHAVTSFPEESLEDVTRLLIESAAIMADKENPYQIQALLFRLVTFIFAIAYKWYLPYMNEIVSNQGRMSDQFLTLAQQHFRQHRFLEFYAQKLEVSPKHLSRTVKAQTGFTAVEWIEKFVILEAKVLLKSSNLNIQQISDELNFASQSFFGKYFKKITGMSPKEFRNRH